MVLKRWRWVLFVIAVSGLVLARDAQAKAGKARYFFKITDVQAQDRSLVPLARDLLEKEVGARKEFMENVGTAESEDARIAELRKRGLDGYQLSMRVHGIAKEPKPPMPGRKDPQLSVIIRLSIFGHTVPEQILKFGGDGEAQVIGEYSEKNRAKDEAVLVQAALTGALKQAVDTAMMKMQQASFSTSRPRKGKKGEAKAP